MAELIVVDASVLIAWLDDRDPHHTDAIEVIASVDHVVVHPLTMAEVLVHPARRDREGEVLARMEAVGVVVSNQPLDPVALARLRAATKLRMPDCVVLACAHAHGMEVATFDAGLRSAAARHRT